VALSGEIFEEVGDEDFIQTYIEEAGGEGGACSEFVTIGLQPK
jgi:hypothetical protein